LKNSDKQKKKKVDYSFIRFENYETKE